MLNAEKIWREHLHICRPHRTSQTKLQVQVLQSVFFWDNVNNQKYVRIILLKMTFFGFPKVNWLHMTGDVDKCVRFLPDFFRDWTYQNLLKSVNFWQNYSKNKKVDIHFETLWHFRYILTETVACCFSDDNAVNCVLWVSWLTSFFCSHVMCYMKSIFQVCDR